MFANLRSVSDAGSLGLLPLTDCMAASNNDMADLFGELDCGGVVVECDTRDLDPMNPPVRNLFNACQFP